ncbi:uncharacterized protein G2W53_023282 [Senna tora]|uniref:Uncharacterized protein n=1 Tax=Senna tora TaxID=362788 RepID=A0A834T9Y0_9FABA|nr:uncharacterized protein G2W53_023282 [Senna tora]
MGDRRFAYDTLSQHVYRVDDVVDLGGTTSFPAQHMPSSSNTKI